MNKRKHLNLILWYNKTWWLDESFKLTPYGYCKGVYDAINTVLSIKEKYPSTPIYCIGQIVHNQYINEKIAQCGH